MLGNFTQLFCRLQIFFQNQHFKKSFRTLSEQPDRDQHHVGPELGPNCLQSLPADDKIRR